MNNKGGIATWAFTFMLGITIIILALALAPAGKSFVDTAMANSTADAIGLNCTDPAISNFNKGTCVITDFSLAYFFIALILIGGGVIVSRSII